MIEQPQRVATARVLASRAMARGLVVLTARCPHMKELEHTARGSYFIFERPFSQ